MLVAEVKYGKDEVLEYAKKYIKRWGGRLVKFTSVKLIYVPQWVVECLVKVKASGLKKGDIYRAPLLSPEKYGYDTYEGEGEIQFVSFFRVRPEDAGDLPFDPLLVKLPSSNFKEVDESELKDAIVLKAYDEKTVEGIIKELVKKKIREYLKVYFLKCKIEKKEITYLQKYLVYLPVYMIEGHRTTIAIHGTTGECIFYKGYLRREVSNTGIAIIVFSLILALLDYIYFMPLYLSLLILGIIVYILGQREVAQQSKK